MTSFVRMLVRWLRRRPAVCICGHTRHAHEHLRRGTDCAFCACERWRRL